MTAQIEENKILRHERELEFLQNFLEWKLWNEKYEKAKFEHLWTSKEFKLLQSVRQYNFDKLEVVRQPMVRRKSVILSKVFSFCKCLCKLIFSLS